MKLVIPKTIPNVHLLQADSKGPAVAPLSGAYPVFYDGARSNKRPTVSLESDMATISLGDLTATACQLGYKQINDIMELLPRMNNVEKKQQLLATLLRVRELFYKIAVVTDFLAVRQNDMTLTEVSSYP